jgi:hypothetical protein
MMDAPMIATLVKRGSEESDTASVYYRDLYFPQAFEGNIALTSAAAIRNGELVRSRTKF